MELLSYYENNLLQEQMNLQMIGYDYEYLKTQNDLLYEDAKTDLVSIAKEQLKNYEKDLDAISSKLDGIYKKYPKIISDLEKRLNDDQRDKYQISPISVVEKPSIWSMMFMMMNFNALEKTASRYDLFINPAYRHLNKITKHTSKMVYGKINTKLTANSLRTAFFTGTVSDVSLTKEDKFWDKYEVTYGDSKAKIDKKYLQKVIKNILDMKSLQTNCNTTITNAKKVLASYKKTITCIEATDADDPRIKYSQYVRNTECGIVLRAMNYLLSDINKTFTSYISLINACLRSK